MMSSAGNRRKTASVGSIAFWYGSGFGAGKAVFPLLKKSPARLPEGSGDPLGEGLSGWVTGGLKQLPARYCDYCFKPGSFAKY